MEKNEKALAYHRQKHGKLEVASKMPLQTKEDLLLGYTPGVAAPCVEIAKDKSAVYEYTFKGNMVAIVSDGSAVLGLGNIGPEAALPVMEGKSLLLKRFANVDAFPLCINTQNPEEIARFVELIAPTFGGVNLEDIASPACVTVERLLEKKLDIPLFHDDQHGTAIVTTAALLNALKLAHKTPADVKVVIAGAGASGYAITKMIAPMGFAEILVCDTQGLLWEGDARLHFVKQEIAHLTNPQKKKGSLAEALKGADIFIGVAVGNIVTEEMVRSMNKESIIFAMANPTPEIMPEQALKAGASIVGTGRGDFPNQINNVLAMPGVFRGTFDAKAKKITEGMKMAAANALASLVSKEKLSKTYILPSVFEEDVVPTVAKAVKEAAIKEGVVRL